MGEEEGHRKKVGAIIFDLDGLLLASEHLYLQVASGIAAEYGVEYPLSLKAKLAGLPDDQIGQVIVETLELPISAQEYLSRRNARLEALWPSCELMPGAERLLRWTAARGVPAAVATSSNSRTLNLKLQGHAPLFEQGVRAMVTSDDEELHGKTKPHPDPFLLAAKRIGANVEDCVVFEDAPNGLKAARAAGMCSIWVPLPFMVPSSPWPPDGAAELGVTQVTPFYQLPMLPVVRGVGRQTLRSLLDFDPVQWDLPPFD